MNYHLPTPAVHHIVGKKLARRVRKGLSATHRALLAYELEIGASAVQGFPRREACRLTGASLGYVATLAKATAAEVEAVKKGKLSLSALHNKPPTDAQVDATIIKLGIERVFAAIDRLTAPIPANDNTATMQAAE
jgi:hypothetical protein